MPGLPAISFHPHARRSNTSSQAPVPDLIKKYQLKDICSYCALT